MCMGVCIMDVRVYLLACVYRFMNTWMYGYMCTWMCVRVCGRTAARVSTIALGSAAK